VVALLVSKGVTSPQHQKLVRGGSQNRYLNTIFKYEDGRREANARSAVGNTLYIPHPDGRLQQDRVALVQDGVRRLIRFSPRDDTVQLPSSTSVAIQLQRPDSQAVGVTRLGPDGCFLYFDVTLSSSCGFFRATVRFARTTMEESGLTRWSVDELAVLYTLYAGVPGHYGLRCITSWCDLIVCLFSSPVPYKLSSMTGFVYWKCGKCVCFVCVC